MAIDTRLQSKFLSDRGTYYRVTIIDTDSSSSTVYNISANDDGFKLTYETNDNDRFTGLIPSKCEFTFLLNENSANVLGIVGSIRTSPYKRWQMLIATSTDDVTYSRHWVGNLLNEINPEDDVSLPRKITLTAICGLAALENIPFNNNIAYSFETQLTCYRYIYNTLVNQIDTENNWSTNSRFIRVMVDWTNRSGTVGILRDVGTDPLNCAAFKSSAYAPIDDNGIRQPKTSFKLLNDICKLFGARMFLAQGIWHFVQVNTYEQMNTSDQFFRDYKKGNNGGNITAPDFTGSTNLNKTEDGTNIQRLAGNTFDYLSKLKQSRTTYDILDSYDLVPLSLTTEGSNKTAANNALVAWNGYHNGVGFRTNGDIYGISFGNAVDEYASYNLGDVAPTTSQTMKFKRKFGRAVDETAGAWGITTNTAILFFHRFKLAGTSGTDYYARSTQLVDGLAEWTTAQHFAQAPSYNGSYSLAADTAGGYFNPLPQNTFTLEFNVDTFPESGTLFFECYAEAWYNFGANDPTTGTKINVSSTEASKLYIYAAAEGSNHQEIKIYVNNEAASKQLFTASQDIANGETYDVGELFIGSGPNNQAQGCLYTFNGTSFDTGNNQSWVAYGGTGGTGINKLLLREILNGQSDGASVFNGTLKILSQNSGGTGYKFNNGITIDSKFYIPYQTTFIANKDLWRGEWYEIKTSSPTLTEATTAVALNTQLDNALYTSAW